MDNYSSIELVRTKSYSLENTNITLEEIKKIYSSVEEYQITQDNMTETDIPFIQADNFERVIEEFKTRIKLNRIKSAGNSYQNLLKHFNDALEGGFSL